MMIKNDQQLSHVLRFIDKNICLLKIRIFRINNHLCLAVFIVV